MSEHSSESDVTFSPHAGTPFEGRYASCVLDSNGNCHRWNHEHPPAQPLRDDARWGDPA